MAGWSESSISADQAAQIARDEAAQLDAQQPQALERSYFFASELSSGTYTGGDLTWNDTALRKFAYLASPDTIRVLKSGVFKLSLTVCVSNAPDDMGIWLRLRQNGNYLPFTNYERLGSAQENSTYYLTTLVECAYGDDISAVVTLYRRQSASFHRFRSSLLVERVA